MLYYVVLHCRSFCDLHDWLISLK